METKLQMLTNTHSEYNGNEYRFAFIPVIYSCVDKVSYYASIEYQLLYPM